MIYYTSDQHFDHTNVIKFDNRPFSSVEEMNEILVNKWNETVTKQDTVYILGDFCWGKADRYRYFLSKLNGTKVLITGNHDLKTFPADIKNMLSDTREFKFIKDNDRGVILCHYPIPFYQADYSNEQYMLYGHLHGTIEEDFMRYFKKYVKQHDGRGESACKCNVYPVFCGFYDWKPVTLNQIIERWRE